MCPPPKPKKPKSPPPQIEAPKVELGAEDANKPGAVRRRRQSGRNQLRTGLRIGGSSSGLSVS